MRKPPVSQGLVFISQRRDSNPRPTVYETVALPAELRWRRFAEISGRVPGRPVFQTIQCIHEPHPVKTFGTAFGIHCALFLHSATATAAAIPAGLPWAGPEGGGNRGNPGRAGARNLRCGRDSHTRPASREW